MPHALLLSPDDQAVTAITGVLEEMSVTCERPLDGVTAAQKLNSSNFDLVLVDCENLPAAKLIFDVCRRGKNGVNPVPIAIVDGRAGLPTAFRLGAELILTKPVAKDQARSTIRTAVSRVRKDAPANEIAGLPPLVPAVSAAASDARPHAPAPSSQLASFAEAATSFSARTASTPASAVPAARLATPPTAVKLQSAVDELEAMPKIADLHSDRTASSSASAVSSSLPSEELSEDPVMVELERKELEEALSASQPPELPNKNASAVKIADEATSATDSPVFSSYPANQRKTSRPLVALLILAILGAGFYGAWTYQPGFREMAQPQIDRVLAMAGLATPKAPAPTPTRSATPAPVAVQTSAAVPGDAASSATAVPDSTNPATNSTPGATPGPASNPSAAPATASTPSITVPVTAPASAAPSASTSSKTASSKTPDASAGDNVPLPGESSAVILSSKGAEKRLSHTVTPKYPADASADGTVVLKEVVDETGKVAGVRLVEGDAALANAAILAVKQWRYRPYLRDGKPQSFQTVVIVDFQKP
jgi:TonB family protein